MNVEPEDRPRSLKYENVRQEREELLRTQNRIQGLREFVENMRRETKQGENIPHFDPLDGGAEARCLFLFEAAGGKAIRDAGKGSGFVSRNNDDASAEMFFRLNEAVGLDRIRTASWNIVPWALRETGKNRPPRSDEIEEGKVWLGKLISKLPDLKVVVLCGNKSQKATGFLYKEYPHLCVLHAPHPSPQSMLQEGKKEYLKASIKKAARILDAGQSYEGIRAVNTTGEGAEI